MQTKQIRNATILAVSLAAMCGCKSEAVFRDKAPVVSSTFEVGASISGVSRDLKGRVIPAELTPLAFRIPGEITRIAFLDGALVKKGDVLVELDSEKLQQQLADAEIQYQLAQKQMKRGEELLGSEMISQSVYDELNANLRIAKVSYQQAKNNLVYAKLKAPFDGVISKVAKERYETVVPGETVVSLHRQDTVQVRTQVSDGSLIMLDPEQRVEAKFSGDERVFELQHLEHTSELPFNAKSYELWYHMPQVESPILPGTSVSITLPMALSQHQQSLQYELPVTALVAASQPGEFYVWKYSDNAAHKARVRVEQANNQGVVVSSGLSEGDIVLTSNLSKVREGAEIVLATEVSKQ